MLPSDISLFFINNYKPVSSISFWVSEPPKLGELFIQYSYNSVQSYVSSHAAINTAETCVFDCGVCIIVPLMSYNSLVISGSHFNTCAWNNLTCKEQLLYSLLWLFIHSFGCEHS